MELPKIDETVTTPKALGLCKHFKLDYLVRRIEEKPGEYKSWKFDGCTGLPDELMGFLVPSGDWKDITYKCCLPHDLGYAYGEPGNEIERERVDLKFKSNLITKAGMEEFRASIFHFAARIGGAEKLGRSFSWAFARKP